MAVTEPAAGDAANEEATEEESPAPVYDTMIRRPDDGPDPLGQEPLAAPETRKGK